MYHGTSFTKLRVFFHKVSSIVNTVFSTFRETLFARHVKLFSEVSELFFHSVQSECILQEAKKAGSRRVLKQEYCGAREAARTIWHLCVSEATRAQTHAHALAHPHTYTHTHWHSRKCVILIALPLQQWFSKRTSMLLYTHIAFLVSHNHTSCWDLL
jgi:hypothetical protein